MAKKQDSTHRSLSFPSENSPTFRGPNGNNYLLVIGIDEYEHFPKLHNAVTDAQNVIDVLTSKYQFDNEHVYTLFNENATEQNINAVFRQLIKEVSSEDNLTIYFSGHGHYDDLEDVGYWIPVDAKDFHEYFSNDRIIRFLKRIDSFHTFLIADSCFSGSLFSGTRSAASDKLDQVPSRWGLTSGMNEPVQDGPMGESSPFAKYFLEYLRNNKQNHLMVSDVIQYVKRAVGANTKQQPVGNRLHGVGDRGMGEFVFYLKEEGTPTQEEGKPKKEREKKKVTVPPVTTSPIQPLVSSPPKTIPSPQARKRTSPIVWVILGVIGTFVALVAFGLMLEEEEYPEESGYQDAATAIVTPDDLVDRGLDQLGISLSIQNLYQELLDTEDPLALDQLQMKADEGDADAQFVVGYIEYITESYSYALSYFEASASQGHTYSQYCLAYMYGQGIGTTVDYDESFSWINQCAEAGNPDCIHYLNQGSYSN